MTRIGLQLGWIAALLCVGAVVVAGAMSDGYSAMQHPIGLLGSAFSSQHGWFNPIGFVLSGMLVVAFAIAFERSLLPSGRVLRIGAGLIVLAGLAFAAQGLFPLDLTDLDSTASRRHAVAHAGFLLAALAAATLLGVASPLWRVSRAAAIVGLIFAALVVIDLVAPSHRWGFEFVPGAVERALVLLWYVWLMALGVSASRKS